MPAPIDPQFTTQTPKLVGFAGLQGYCTASAGDAHGTVYASFIGRKTALTGIWAAFQDREELKVMDGAPLRKRLTPEAATYHTLKVRLPNSGWQHLVLLHSQATTDNLTDEDFYVLSLASGVPIQLFFTQWNNAVPCPAKPEWAGQLWAEGQRAGLITELDAEGIHAWCIQAHDDWVQVLQEILRRQSAEQRCKGAERCPGFVEGVQR